MSSQQTATVYAEGVRTHRQEKQSLEENQMQQWETSTGMGLWKLYEEELKYNAECFITLSSKSYLSAMPLGKKLRPSSASGKLETYHITRYSALAT